MKKLRTLIILEASNQLVDPFIFLENNHHLRILHVGPGSTSFSARPKWRSLSAKLNHLRYLRLTSLDVTEVVYDESIGKLYNLETLLLNNMDINVQFLLTNVQSLKKLRYLEVSYTNMVELPDSVTSLSNLRTLDLNNCKLKFIPDSISCLESLKFLNLSDNPFEKLPASVVTLSNLATLDVNTCKNLEALPESVRGLAKLRIFDLKHCQSLKELPEDLGTLTQLRYLNLVGTCIRVLPESCANLNNLEYAHLFKCEVPKYVKNWTKLRQFYSRWGHKSGAGELVFLESLYYSVPEKVINEPERNVGIEELRNLSFLEELIIRELQNVEDPADAERANLKGKQNLRILGLSWDEFPRYWNHRSAEVFEALQPPTGLRVLIINNFMGRVFPDWMCLLPSGLPNLVRLNLINCTGTKTLPDIGEFPSLTRLELSDMHILEELCYLCASLQDLTIIDCKSLKEIPSYPSLMILELKKVNHKLVCSVGISQMTSLTDLRLENIEDLIYFPVSILQKNCNLQILVIKGCNQLKGFGVNEDELLFKNSIIGSKFYSTSLQWLTLVDCAVLKFLPDLRGWTCLQKLTIFNCPLVKDSLTYDLKSLSFLKGLFVDFIKRDEERGDPSNTDELINLMEK